MPYVVGDIVVVTDPELTRFIGDRARVYSSRDDVLILQMLKFPFDLVTATLEQIRAIGKDDEA